MKSHTDTLISAMAILARDIHCDDGVATAAIAEAGTRLLEQRDEIARLRLTDAEREVLERLAERLNDWNMDDAEDVVRGLLERTK